MRRFEFQKPCRNYFFPDEFGESRPRHFVIMLAEDNPARSSALIAILQGWKMVTHSIKAVEGTVQFSNTSRVECNCALNPPLHDISVSCLVYHYDSGELMVLQS